MPPGAPRWRRCGYIAYLFLCPHAQQLLQAEERLRSIDGQLVLSCTPDAILVVALM